MRRTLAAALAATALAWPAAAQQTLNVATAGDQNMVDYIKDYLGPMFEKTHPGVKVIAVGTGPGDAGSQKIYEKLDAQKKGGAAKSDFDVVVIHQKAAGTMVNEGLLEKYTDKIPTGALATRDTAKNALGAEVSGLRHADVPLADRDRLQSRPREGRAELLPRAHRMGEEEPEAVRLQRHQGRHVRRRLRVGLGLRRSAATPTSSRRVPTTPRPRRLGTRRSPTSRSSTPSVVITPGNAGTLDMLNRGEIAMGPVWVDMFYTWMADGKLPPNMKLKLVAPGMPGQPMYYAMPAKANAKLAEEFVALATSPEVQAEGIVKRFNWYPGIDAKNLEGKLDQAAWKKLFADISPEDLSSKGKPFPIAPYFNDILEAYERKVAN